MTKLTYSKKMKILTFAGTIILSVGVTWGFFYFLFDDFRSIVTWGIMFPCFALFVSLSIFGIREVFFAYCSFDDEKGIEFYSGFTKVKKIPVSSLTAFLVADNGISISYQKRINDEEKVKSFIVSKDFQNLQSLYEWLDSHVRNLNKEQLSQSIDEFNESHSELTDDEKGKLLHKTYLFAKILKWIGAIVAVFLVASLFVNRSLMRVAFIVCAIYPILLFLIMRFSNGEIRFNVKTSDLYPSLLSPFSFCSASLMFASVIYLDWIYSFSKQLCISALVALIMFFIYYACASKSEKQMEGKLSSRIISIISIIFLMLMYGIGFSIPANIIFDKSEPTIYEVSVINQRVSKGRHTDYYLEVSPWINKKINQKEISVGSKLYSEVEIGDKVNIKLYKGFLGVPWFKAVEIKKYKKE